MSPVHALKPSSRGWITSMTANVPIIDTGTARSGINVVRSLPRNRNTTIPTSTNAITRLRITSAIVVVTKTVLSQNTV